MYPNQNQKKQQAAAAALGLIMRGRRLHARAGRRFRKTPPTEQKGYFWLCSPWNVDISSGIKAVPTKPDLLLRPLSHCHHLQPDTTRTTIRTRGLTANRAISRPTGVKQWSEIVNQTIETYELASAASLCPTQPGART